MSLDHTSTSDKRASVTVGDVIAVLDDAYPPHLAESWDAVGLICGDPEASVSRVAFALDCTDDVVEAAIAQRADMLVVHHPLLLRGVTGVGADTPKGRIIHQLITNGIALFAAHTNADSARPGVNDRLAELLGVYPGPPLRPIPEPWDKWGVTIPAQPADAATAVMEAVFDAGAGRVSNYDRAAYHHVVTGQFRPLEGANPAVGSIGEVEEVSEVRWEFVAPASRRGAITKALCEAHPYEHPAFDVVENKAEQPGAEEIQLGIGRVGDLDEPMTLREFTQRVAQRLPNTRWGIRAAGDPEAVIRRVAVASGAGDSFLDTVAAMDVDCFVTSDLRHHPVDEHLRKGGCAVIDTAHWASEFPWCDQAAGIVADAVTVETAVIDIVTDPWTIHAESDEVSAAEAAGAAAGEATRKA